MTMSVQLTEGGKNTQFTDRTVPWMKLGKIVNGAVSAKEAAEKGGLNFTVSAHKVYFSCDTTVKDFTSVVEDTSPECLREMTNRRVIVRDDTLLPLGIVSDNYPILQYGEAFDFMDTVSSEYVAAGALKGGKQGYMVVRLPEDMQINVLDGADPHEMFGVLRTSMDLTRAVEVMAMPLRGLCMNQLTLSSFSKMVPHRWAVPHRSTMHDKLADAKVALGNLGQYAKRFNELAKRLAGVKVNEEQARYLLTSKVVRKSPRSEDTVNLIVENFKMSPVVGFKGTGWGLVNAVSEYFDWGRKGGSPESRFLASIEGQTHKAINRTAAEILTTLEKK